MSAPNPLEVHGLRCSVGAFTLGPVDLTVAPGRIVALIGANGAGKSTLIRTLMGRMRPSSGVVTILGRPVDPMARRHLDVMADVPDDPEQLVPELTAREYWELCAWALTSDSDMVASMVARAEQIAQRLDFKAPQRVLIAGFSHGMRKKTQVAAALMRDPQILVLDEPRNGLDAIGIDRLESLVTEFVGRGGAVLAATHDLHWADRVAHGVLALHEGAVVASGAIATLCSPGESVRDMFFRSIDEAANASGSEPGHAHI